MIRRIVLTGGPCAGKTTAIQKIVQEFEEKGINVFVVPEAATLLINMGIRPFGKNALSTLEFQKNIFDISLKLEKMAENAARKSERDSIILYDRGLIDSKAYMTEYEWKRMISHYNFKDASLYNKYDLVLHLKTVADGKEELYTLSNNNARTETVSEAKLLDLNTLRAWIGHDNLKILGNDGSFDEKINKGIVEIYNTLGKPFPIKRQMKYLVSDVNEEDLYKKTNGQVFRIEQYVVQHGEYEAIFRKTNKKTDESYKMILKKDTGVNNERITTQRKITETDYYSNLPKDVTPISKTRYCFEYDNSYYKLDTFDDGLTVLEIDETNKTKEITIPPFIGIEKDVSNDKTYRNSYIYNLRNKKDVND